MGRNKYVGKPGVCGYNSTYPCNDQCSMYWSCEKKSKHVVMTIGELISFTDEEIKAYLDEMEAIARHEKC